MAEHFKSSHLLAPLYCSRSQFWETTSRLSSLHINLFRSKSQLAKSVHSVIELRALIHWILSIVYEFYRASRIMTEREIISPRSPGRSCGCRSGRACAARRAASERPWCSSSVPRQSLATPRLEGYDVWRTKQWMSVVAVQGGPLGCTLHFCWHQIESFFLVLGV